MSNLQIINTFNSAAYDADRLSYYQRYFNDYYNDAFRPNQGTEAILDTLRRHAIGGAWLDLGAGPATLFWGLMLSGVTRLWCSEITEEGLKVLDDFLRSNNIPKCYRDVMQMYKISERHVADLRSIERTYCLFDALVPWPEEIASQPFDLVTAFGVFGLSLSSRQYQDCFGLMKPGIRVGGRAIGANWIRSQHFIDQGNSDNRYIGVDLVQQAADKYGFKVLHLSREAIHGDRNYDGVVVWALERIS